MVITNRRTRPGARPHRAPGSGGAGPHYITRDEAERLLDEQARKYLNMSGDEFREKYESGELRASENPDFRRVAFLIPMSEA